MEDNVPWMKINFCLPEGSRKKGRPILRWLDSLLKDLETFEVKARWKKARDKDMWSEIIREVRGRKGL